MSSSSNHSDRKLLWEDSHAYELYMGRWSRQVARAFLAWLAVPSQSRWLDIGCGTGALSQAILAEAAPREVCGVDRSSAFVAFARTQVQAQRVRFAVGDAQCLPFAGSICEAAVSGLALNFVPVAARALGEMARVVRPEGIVAAYLWDYAGEMQMLRHFWNAAAALDPASIDLDEGQQFAICKPEALASLWKEGGLGEVAVSSIEIPTDFHDFEEYWRPFLAGQGPAPGYVRSLTQERCRALRAHLQASLPLAPDGGIHLIARAWAVRGRRLT